ncbi:MAG: hypothetical protein ACM4D3_13330 [Candidatus Sericytochromatia bacterium]
MTANVTSFAQECQDAMTAVLDAVAASGPKRREHLAAAKLAVAKALHEAHTAEEWSFAEHLRRAIKDVEIHPRDAA